MKSENYQICKRCVMDTTDPHIVFDENGICSHCRRYDTLVRTYVFKGKEGEAKLQEIFDEIKTHRSQRNKYDALLGVSGGVDSSYVAHIARNYGLNVLLVHLDNEWDTEISKRNVSNIAKHTGYDIEYEAANWEEFKDLQLAYIRASVVNIEIATDQALAAVIWKTANNKGIRYILNGSNIVTEGIMPKSWGYRNDDIKNLRNIHRKFGKIQLKTYPMMSRYKIEWYRKIKGIKTVSPLNYVEYNREKAKKILHYEFEWEDYGQKHWESIFTRFYQMYILPKKFGIDKRRAHLSALVCAGQISREEAVEELKKPAYSYKQCEEDKKFALEKLGLSEKEFEHIMNLRITTHQEYGTDYGIRIITGLKRILGRYE